VKGNKKAKVIVPSGDEGKSLKAVQDQANKALISVGKIGVTVNKVGPTLNNTLKMVQNNIRNTSVMLNKFNSTNINASTNITFNYSLQGDKGAEEKAQGAFTKIWERVKSIGTVAVKTGVEGLGKLISSTTESASKLDQMKNATGLDYEELQKLQYISGQLSVDFDKAGGAASTMFKNMSSGGKTGSETANAFKTLGVQVNGSKPRGQVFNETIAALSQMQDQTHRNELAFKIFGSSAEDLFPILNAGTGEIQRLGSESDKLGMVMSNEQVAAAQNYGGVIDKVKLSFAGLGNQIASRVIPIIGPFIQEIINRAPEIQNTIISIVDAISQKIMEIVPPLLDSMSEIIDKAMEIYNFINDNWSLIEPIIVGVGAAVTGYKIAMMALNKETLLGMVVQKLVKAWQYATKVLVLLRDGASLATIAQKALNFAWNTNPIGVVCAAIGVLIGLGILLYKNWDAICAGIVGIWQNNIMPILSEVGAWFVQLGEGAKNIFTSIVNFFIWCINMCIRGLNSISITLPDWLPDWLGGGKTFGINIPELTPLAKGGIATQPSICGEAGPEMAIPIRYKNPRSLSLLNQTAKAIGAEPGGSMPGVALSFNFYGPVNNKNDVCEGIKLSRDYIVQVIEDMINEKERVAFG